MFSCTIISGKSMDLKIEISSLRTRIQEIIQKRDEEKVIAEKRMKKSKVEAIEQEQLASTDVKEVSKFDEETLNKTFDSLTKLEMMEGDFCCSGYSNGETEELQKPVARGDGREPRKDFIAA